MTPLPHEDFETSLEKAEAWMKEIHERLKENDNTQGPRSALESRLRDTERICALEADGKLLVDKALMKAEILLSDSSEEERHEIHLKLAKLKGLFEETTTYMIHCHSRIEWVWLHWSEYLRARDEFTLWVHNIRLALEPEAELQLGLKEKRWQYEQAGVLTKDVLNQSHLVDRLLEEASSLYNRIGDPSVEESVQSAMMADYMQIKKKAQERVEHLEKIWKDHDAYEGDISGFKSWLNSVIEKLKFYVGAASNSTENRLSMLQDISKDVENGEKQVEELEVKSAQVIKNTSPLGAEKICKELEELRKTLKELKQMNDEEEETLLKTHNSENAFVLLAKQLEANIKEFSKATQRLEESLESGERVQSEDNLIALWKTLNATKSALAAEEAKAERVKVQLRDLFKFSKDVQPLSDGVISAMRDYQRVKSKAFKLSTDTESELRQIFQNPLREFLYWKPVAESVLDATTEPVNDGAMNRDALENIEKLLQESCDITEELGALDKKEERIHLVLGEEKTRALLQDIAAAEREREALHGELLQRKVWLQSLAEQRKQLDSVIKTLHSKLSAIRMTSSKEKQQQQSDIIGKEAQVQRLQILLQELMSLGAPIHELISVTKPHPGHVHRAEQLNSDFLTLQRGLQNMIRKMKENIEKHRTFCHNLQDLQRWIVVTAQNLESGRDERCSPSDIQILKDELSEKEIQLHLVETQGQEAIATSSPEGGALIQNELKELSDSWKSLQQLCEHTARNDLSGYKFRVLDQRDERQEETPARLRRTDSDTDIVTSAGNPKRSEEISRGRGFRRIENQGSVEIEVNGADNSGESEAQDPNGGSSKFYNLDQGTNPSHVASKTKSSALVTGDLVSRTDRQDDAELHLGAGFQISPGNLRITSGKSLVAEENKQKSPNNPMRTRRNIVALAESVDLVDGPSPQRTGGDLAGDDHVKLLAQFQQWLQGETSKLNRICADHVSGSEGAETLQSRLQNLHFRVPRGQKLFESLLSRRRSMTVTEELKMEELRYLWMLYKSKLRDCGKHSNLKPTEEPRAGKKVSSGLCGFLRRVCCAALPLQLLLLLLLLLSFLLPLLHDTKNCALSNNFARSFNLMLKYEGPPPT